MAFLNQLEHTVDDFEQQVSKAIQQYGDRTDFPQLSDYELTQAMLTDYLFDKQAILDSGGSERTRLTIAGFLIVAPVLAFSLYRQDRLPWGRYTLFVAVCIGIVLFALYKLALHLFIRHRLKRQENPAVERYVQAVLAYRNHKVNA